VNNVVAWEYPWLQDLLESFQRSHKNSALAHAYILAGSRGLGKKQIALEFASFLTCERPSTKGHCGECKSCLLNVTANHPDVLYIAPNEPGKALTVDQIRRLSDYVHVSSHAGGAKVAVLAEADRMNSSASNALLKTLEEPHESTYLFLVTDSLGLLSPTIRSRCQRITLPTPSQAVSLEWMRARKVSKYDEQLAISCLKASGGSPLLAMEMLLDESLPTRQALEHEFIACLTGNSSPDNLLATLLKTEPITAIEHILSTTAHCAKLMLVNASESHDSSKDTSLLGGLAPSSAWDRFLEQVKTSDGDYNARRRAQFGNRLVRLYDEIEKARRQLQSSSNPNSKLLLGSLCWLTSRALK
jgi:DNA polymerase-3 subunit delta'